MSPAITPKNSAEASLRISMLSFGFTTAPFFNKKRTTSEFPLNIGATRNQQLHLFNIARRHHQGRRPFGGSFVRLHPIVKKSSELQSAAIQRNIHPIVSGGVPGLGDLTAWQPASAVE